MRKMKIAVLMGGPSAEREVSLRSGTAVANALTATGARVVPMDIRDAGFAIPADALSKISTLTVKAGPVQGERVLSNNSGHYKILLQLK